MLGVGGVNPDDPKFQAYRKRHLEVTGQEPDRWASPVTYASLEILQQAIERVGKIDRDGDHRGDPDRHVRHRRRHRSSSTSNVNTNVWWAGQWQNGEFYGLAPATMAGAKEPVAPKPAWKPAQ